MSYLYPFNTKFDGSITHLSGGDAGQNSRLLYSEDDMKRIEAQAYELGYNKGKIQGIHEGGQNLQEHINQSIVSLLENISGKIDQSFKSIEEVEFQVNQVSLCVAQKIIEKIMPSYADKYGYENLQNLIKDVLSSLFDKQQIKIKVSPHNYDEIKSHFNDISVRQGHEITVEESAEVKAYDCAVEWEGGGASISHSKLSSQIVKILDKHLEVFFNASNQNTPELPLCESENSPPEGLCADIIDESVVDEKP
jgi:flagellar biosynthesis/type III secretory pathway protein FliH